MNILSPSILAADFAILGKQINEVHEAGAQYLHIDVMDGIFVPQISFGMPVITSLRKSSDMFFDVHIMIDRPERYAAEFVDCGADMVTFHLEATEQVVETIGIIRAKGAKVGISIKPGTPVADVVPYLPLVDMVLIMTVEPGYGGQSYIPYCTDKVKEVRRAITEQGLTCDVQVDGGIGTDNLQMVLEAGANMIVAGSAVFKNNITENVTNMLKIMGEK
ncbi:MAG: ribulose-phosphate 3-epimerase [Lachnospiraceae bacterium]|nr:ribulose-phosphate 3-epimerase [Lachnospiraceae bacterium]